MGSARDSAPDAARMSSSLQPHLTARPCGYPVSASELRGDPLGSRGAIPASTPPSAAAAAPGRQPKLLDRLRDALRARHYSRRTEQTYCHWVKRFIFFHDCGQPLHGFATEHGWEEVSDWTQGWPLPRTAKRFSP